MSGLSSKSFSNCSSLSFSGHQVVTAVTETTLIPLKAQLNSPFLKKQGCWPEILDVFAFVNAVNVQVKNKIQKKWSFALQVSSYSATEHSQ